MFSFVQNNISKIAIFTAGGELVVGRKHWGEFSRGQLPETNCPVPHCKIGILLETGGNETKNCVRPIIIPVRPQI